jgi:hypothetical protein
MLLPRGLGTARGPGYIVPAASDRTVTSPACAGRLLTTERQVRFMDYILSEQLLRRLSRRTMRMRLARSSSSCCFCGRWERSLRTPREILCKSPVVQGFGGQGRPVQVHLAGGESKINAFAQTCAGLIAMLDTRAARHLLSDVLGFWPAAWTWRQLPGCPPGNLHRAGGRSIHVNGLLRNDWSHFGIMWLSGLHWRSRTLVLPCARTESAETRILRASLTILPGAGP